MEIRREIYLNAITERLHNGMKKKDYFARSCIYNKVCVVGKKETVYAIVERLNDMEKHLEALQNRIMKNAVVSELENIEETKEKYLDMLEAILCILDGAKYLWKE